jgi:hypothetical protein
MNSSSFYSPSDCSAAMRRCGETGAIRCAEESRRRRRSLERFEGWRIDYEMSLDVFTYCM